MGRPKKEFDSISIRVEKSSYILAKKAADALGESMVDYASRILRENAFRDMLKASKEKINKILHDLDALCSTDGIAEGDEKNLADFGKSLTTIKNALGEEMEKQTRSEQEIRKSGQNGSAI